jgi:cobalt-zinc-cadmium efflux system outer membrane protein
MSACRLSSAIASLVIFITALIAGCTTFRAQPISPSDTASSFEARTLDNIDLKKFIETNLHRKVTPWPPKSWNLKTLTLIAFYYHPDLDVVRAKWGVSEAGVITAGGRPNPALGVSAGFYYQSRKRA